MSGDDKLFVGPEVCTLEAATLSHFLSLVAVKLEVTQYGAENGHMCACSQSRALCALESLLAWGRMISFR